jgi:hypothetical protein
MFSMNTVFDTKYALSPIKPKNTKFVVTAYVTRSGIKINRGPIVGTHWERLLFKNHIAQPIIGNTYAGGLDSPTYIIKIDR